MHGDYPKTGVHLLTLDRCNKNVNNSKKCKKNKMRVELSNEITS